MVGVVMIMRVIAICICSKSELSYENVAQLFLTVAIYDDDDDDPFHFH